MRRNDREVRQESRIRGILSACKVCRLGLQDGEEVYVVPMNYGYIWESGVLTLYFHCATEGRRLDLLARHPRVGFEMDCHHALTGTGDVACTYSYQFASIIGTGTVERLEEPAEKMEGLRCIMACQCQMEFSFTEQMVEHVAVLRLTATEFSCKEHP